MFLMPPIVLLMLQQSDWTSFAAIFLFVIASITDYYDGYFARKFNAISNFGKFMDPVADKVLVSGLLVVLLQLQRIDLYMVILILVRDTYIGGLRAVAAADNIIISAKPTGKWKTALQMSSMPLLMIEPHFVESLWLNRVAYGALWISVILSVVSAVEYRNAYQVSRNKT